MVADVPEEFREALEDREAVGTPWQLKMLRRTLPCPARRTAPTGTCDAMATADVEPWSSAIRRVIHLGNGIEFN